MLTRKFADPEKNEVHKGHRKVKCELNQAQVMITVLFN